MRIIKTEVIEETRITHIHAKINHSSLASNVKKVTSQYTKVIVDSIDQRYELAEYLKSKKFKQTDGMFGEQKDFSVMANYNAGKPEEHYILLEFKNQKRYERLIQTVIEYGKAN